MSQRSVLCAVDFSAASDAAVRLAAEEAERRDAVIDLVHVWQPTTGFLGDAAAIPVDLECPTAQLQAELHRIKPALANDRVRRHVVVGDPAAQLVETAEELGSEVIVVGTHARHGLAHWLIGSVAEQVLHHAPCPVLVCRGPQQAETHAAPRTGGNAGGIAAT